MGKISSKQTTKKNLWLYLSLLFGLVLFLLPFIYFAYTQQKQDHAKVVYQKATKHVDSKQLEAARNYNRQIFTQQQVNAGAAGEKYINSVFTREQLKQPIGYISIPAIHLDPMVIYYG